MKIIALLPIKNEGWILETCLQSLVGIADEIIAIDDGSTDNSVKILKKYNTTIIPFRKDLEISWAEHSIRQKLLEAGREHNGTHFICIDGDEAFSPDFQKNGRDIILKMKPGDKLELKWITLWLSTSTYRNDGLYKELYKDFIFCDDKKSNYPYAFLGVARTPKSESLNKNIRVIEDDGVMLHFQYIFFKRSQLKQAWYKCSEFLKNEKSARRINQMYSHSMPTSEVLMPAPEKWQIKLFSKQNPDDFLFYLSKIKNWFKIYGIEKFEPLEIWHTDDLYNLFLESKGRKPKPKKYSIIIILLNSIKINMINLLKGLTKKVNTYNINSYIKNKIYKEIYKFGLGKKIYNKIINSSDIISILKNNDTNGDVEISFRDNYKIICPKKNIDVIIETCVNEDYSGSFYKIKKDDLIIDIGANLGSFSMYAANKGANVLSFEPDSYNFNYLLKNIKINNFENKIKAYNVAISDKPGTVKLSINDNHACNSIMDSDQYNTLDVTSTTIDIIINELKIQKINLIKIDVEGAEYIILPNISKESYKKIEKIIGEYHLFKKETGFNFNLIRKVLKPHFSNIKHKIPYYFTASK